MKAHAIVASAVIALIATTAPADLINYTYQPSDPDLDDLVHQRAYEWNFELGLGAGEVISSAELILHGIRDWTVETNVLYIHLLEGDSGNLGVSEYWDNQGGGNYFAGQGIELITYHNLPATAQTRTHTFTGSQLTTLNNYAADDVIGLGLDPDCHFYNCGVELRLTTVPEPATAALMTLAALPALLSRRRR